MTDITPPPELVQQWFEEASKDGAGWPRKVADAAAQWGADTELEACCHEVQSMYSGGSRLRAARRPKPPSLKEQALHEIAGVYNRDEIDDAAYDIIRRALEQLDD